MTLNGILKKTLFDGEKNAILLHGFRTLVWLKKQTVSPKPARVFLFSLLTPLACLGFVRRLGGECDNYGPGRGHVTETGGFVCFMEFNVPPTPNRIWRRGPR